VNCFDHLESGNGLTVWATRDFELN
jgi:hypothetical protein